MNARYLLLYGVLSAKKPTHYCSLHKCGVSKNHCKRRCWKCKHLRNISDALARDIRMR